MIFGKRKWMTTNLVTRPFGGVVGSGIDVNRDQINRDFAQQNGDSATGKERKKAAKARSASGSQIGIDRGNEMFEELGISFGTALIVLLALYLHYIL